MHFTKSIFLPCDLSFFVIRLLKSPRYKIAYFSRKTLGFSELILIPVLAAIYLKNLKHRQDCRNDSTEKKLRHHQISNLKSQTLKNPIIELTSEIGLKKLNKGCDLSDKKLADNLHCTPCT